MSGFPPFQPHTDPAPSEKPKRRGRGPARKPRQPAASMAANFTQFVDEAVGRKPTAAKNKKPTSTGVLADIIVLFQKVAKRDRPSVLAALERIFA